MEAPCARREFLALLQFSKFHDDGVRIYPDEAIRAFAAIAFQGQSTIDFFSRPFIAKKSLFFRSTKYSHAFAHARGSAKRKQFK